MVINRDSCSNDTLVFSRPGYYDSIRSIGLLMVVGSNQMRSPMGQRIAVDSPAPDFTLPDYRGTPVTLSGYHGKQHVILVFNRGFT